MPQNSKSCCGRHDNDNAALANVLMEAINKQMLVDSSSQSIGQNTNQALPRQSP
jgi:hypothetical protein